MGNAINYGIYTSFEEADQVWVFALNTFWQAEVWPNGGKITTPEGEFEVVGTVDLASTTPVKWRFSTSAHGTKITPALRRELVSTWDGVAQCVREMRVSLQNHRVQRAAVIEEEALETMAFATTQRKFDTWQRIAQRHAAVGDFFAGECRDEDILIPEFDRLFAGAE